MSVEDIDVIVVGAGAAGLACALHAAKAGARVLVLEKDRRIGGTLHLSGGHLAAAGTPEQAAVGIEDSPQRHLQDIERISGGSARTDLVTQVVEHAADTLSWLNAAGFRNAPGTPRTVYGHEPYRTPRTVYGVDEGASILAALTRELDQHQDHLTLVTAAPVSGLVLEADRVVWVEAWVDGREQVLRSGAVVVATGGYGADPELFAELEGAPLVSAAARTSTGDGLHLGLAVGAALQGQGSYLSTFGGLPDPTNPGRANWHDRLLLTSERAPVEIYVDRHGARWVAEDEPSIDEKERALVHLDQQTFWVVLDQDGMRATEHGPARWVGHTPAELSQAANHRVGVHAAETLSGLAALAGIDPAGLIDTVGRYNEAVALGRDEDFGRQYLPAPIARGPFYAIRNHAITLITFTGLDIDAQCAVRSEQGEAIAGLYAVGEVIGAGATCGNSFCSGMLLTPALTLGRLLGTRLGHEALSDAGKM